MEELYKAKVKELQEQAKVQAEQIRCQGERLEEITFYIQELVAKNRELKGEMLIMGEAVGVNRKTKNKSTQTKRYCQQTEKYHNVSTQTENDVQDAEINCNLNGDNLTWVISR